MKLRILFITLMVTLMANAVFGVGEIRWDIGATANWTEEEGTGLPYHWWIEGSPDVQAWAIPDGTAETLIYGPDSDVTVNTDVAFTSWFSNRGRVFGGATLRIEDGANVEGFGWLRIGEGSKPGDGMVIHTGGTLKLENGPRLNNASSGDYKDPAGLTIGDGNTSINMGTGLYVISNSASIEMLHYSQSTGRQCGNIRIGDRRGEGTLRIEGSNVSIKMNALDIGGRNDKINDATRPATGHLEYVLDAGGASVIDVNYVNVHSYDLTNNTVASYTTLKVTLGAVLDTPGNDILLVNNGGTEAVYGVFDRVNGHYAGEGIDVDLGDGVERILTYVGGDGNDIVLKVVPEPATLALLSLGMFIIRRKK